MSSVSVSDAVQIVNIAACIANDPPRKRSVGRASKQKALVSWQLIEQLRAAFEAAGIDWRQV